MSIYHLFQPLQLPFTHLTAGRPAFSRPAAYGPSLTPNPLFADRRIQGDKAVLGAPAPLNVTEHRNPPLWSRPQTSLDTTPWPDPYTVIIVKRPREKIRYLLQKMRN